jgi:hypothetical protein
MIKKTFKAAFLLILSSIIMLSSSCYSLDVIGQDSVRSFDLLLESQNGGAICDEANCVYTFSSPDKDVTLNWSYAYDSDSFYDLYYTFDAAAFIQAGLDISRLPEQYRFDNGKITVGRQLGDEKLASTGEMISPNEAYRNIVVRKRRAVGYHNLHYNLDLENGNLFEWARFMNKDLRDVTFYLDPFPLIEAGVDPNLVQGWDYISACIMENGEDADVDKFAKNYNVF